MFTTKRIAAAGAALALTGLASFGTATTASAGNDGDVRDWCQGVEIESVDMIGERDGKKYGTLRLYYSPEKGGQNCAMTFTSIGGRHETVAVVETEDGRQQGDRGKFYSYAGGAYLNNTDGICANAWGAIYLGNDHWATGYTVEDHCG